MLLFTRNTLLPAWLLFYTVLGDASALRVRQLDSGTTSTAVSGSPVVGLASNASPTIMDTSLPQLPLTASTTIVTSHQYVASTTSAANPSLLSSTLPSSSTFHAAQHRTSSNGTGTTTHSQEGTLPLEPHITPALSIGGSLLIVTGLIYMLIGIKSPWIHVFLSSAYLTSLSITVLIVYVVNPPVSHGIQGAYLVAVVATGLLLGAGSLLLKSIAQGLCCLLGGFCLSMWVLVLKPGGTIHTTIGKVVFILVLSLVTWSLSFHPVVRPYGLIGCMSFSGATAVILGVDCFSRAGLKEFWLYIWKLNDNIFPPHTHSYPITKGVRAETAAIIILCLIGLGSQWKLWTQIKSYRPKDADGREDENQRSGLEEAKGRYLEARNDLEKAVWERTYGEPSRSSRPTSIVPAHVMGKQNRKSRLSAREMSLANLPTGQFKLEEFGPPKADLPTASRPKRQSTMTVRTIPEDDEWQQENNGSIANASSKYEEVLLDSRYHLSGASSFAATSIQGPAGSDQNSTRSLMKATPGSASPESVSGTGLRQAERDRNRYTYDPASPAPTISPNTEELKRSHVLGSELFQPDELRSILGQTEVESPTQIEFATGPIETSESHQIATTGHNGSADGQPLQPTVSLTRSIQGRPSPLPTISSPQGAQTASGHSTMDSQNLSSKPSRPPLQKPITTVPEILISRGASAGSQRATYPPKIIFNTSLPSPDRTSMSSPVNETSESRSPPISQPAMHTAPITRPLLAAKSRSYTSPQLIRSTSEARLSAARLSRTASPMHQQALAATSDTRLSSYIGSHQPERKPSTFVPQKREALLAGWRNSLHHEATTSIVPRVALERRRSDMIVNKRQSTLGKQWQDTHQLTRDVFHDEAMRRPDMQALHKDAMKKLQAGANKHI